MKEFKMVSNSNRDGITSEGDLFVDQLVHILEKELSSGHLSTEKISGELGVSSSTFYRRVKKYTGCTPTEYIKKFQLKKAAKLLSANFGNISEVAYEVGFNNLSYFSKCFKEKYGVTPTQYLKASKAKKNLPLHLTSFVGREQELADIQQLIRSHRLVSLTGPAGSGKTRLAEEILNWVNDSFKDDTAAVYLASLSDSDHVPSAILQQLNIIENPASSSMDNLIDYLRDKEMLLMLDNVEHLLPAAQNIKTLVQSCPDLSVLTTTREVLHLSGEYEYQVPPLSLPEQAEEIDEESLGSIADNPCVRLFVERARSVKPDFQLAVDNAAPVIHICTILDGLPLALELAASQVKMVSLIQLSNNLDEDLKFLKTGDIDRPKRHNTLAHAITWSYELLTRLEKILFQRISLFPGSFNLQGAEILWENMANKLDTMDGLRSLLDKNFLQSYEKDDEIRFFLLETLKAYGRDRLKEQNNELALIRQLARYYLELAQQAESNLKGANQKKWLNRLNTDLDNFRGILKYLEDKSEVKLGLQLATALWRFWNMKNMVQEGSGWLKKMIDLANKLKYSEGSRDIYIMKGKALSALGILRSMLSEDYQKDANIFRQCTTVFRKINDKQGLAENLNHYGWIKAHMGDYKEAKNITIEAKTLHEKLKNDRGISVSYNNMGWIAKIQGNLEEARDLYTRSVKLRDKIGDMRGFAYVSTNLAWTEKNLGDYETARTRLEKSHDILEELDDRQLVSWVHTITGYLLYDLAHYQEGSNRLETAIEGWSRVGNRYGLSLSNDLLGLCLLGQNNSEMIRRHLDQAHSYWTRMHSKWGLAFSLFCLAQFEHQIGRVDKALSLHKEALSSRIKQNEKLNICESLEACANIMVEREQFEPATVYISSAFHLRDTISAPRPPRLEYIGNNVISKCRQKMENARFNKALKRGKDHSLDQLLNL